MFGAANQFRRAFGPAGQRAFSGMPPAQTQKMLQQAVDLHQKGRFAQAEAIYSRLRVMAPRDFDVLHLSGALALQQNRLTEAIGWLEQAKRLSPNSKFCLLRLGMALLYAGRAPEAEPYLRRVVELDPKWHEGWDALAFLCKTLDRLPEAVECHYKVITLKPDYAGGWYNFGLTLSLFGRTSDVLRCHDQALVVDPKYALARFGRAQALHQSNRTLEALAEYDRYLALEPENLDAWSYRLLALIGSAGITREQLFAEHQNYGRRAKPKSVAKLTADPSPDRRLRVAILSPDMRVHSCAYFLEPLLQHLDRDAFELYLYHDHYRSDEVTKRFRKLATVWRDFIGQSGTMVEKAIRADQPDILIDLAGHTGVTGGRLQLFAHRLAPVQINYLGYPNTTGLEEMDYRFTDALADPVGDADRFATEKLVRFAPTAWTYQPPENAPAVAPPPSASTGAITFGCFNNLSKLTDEMIAVWARLLATVPQSRLLLKGIGLALDPEIRAHYESRLTAQGISLDRVEMLDRTMQTEEHLAIYHRVDVALDTFPYHGTTTTCEALWMGVPVVPIQGDRHSSRVGVSLLHAVGHPEWIARNTDEYIRLAAELAGDIPRLTALRARLRSDMAASVLMDHAGQGDRFGAALRECWRAWCRKATNSA